MGEFRQGFHFQCLAISEMLLEGTCMSVFCFVSCICIVMYSLLIFCFNIYIIFHFLRKIKENCPTYILINNSLIIDSTDTNLELAKSLTRTNRTKGTKKNIYITYHLNLQKLLISAPIITSSIVMIIKSYLMTFCGVRFLGPRAGQHMQNSMAY